MEAELERTEADKEELQTQLRWGAECDVLEELEIYYSAMADSAVGETEHLKREIAYLEAQIPSDNASREIEKQINREKSQTLWNVFLAKLTFISCQPRGEERKEKWFN
mgnify:CR=1 FL=1